MVTEQELTERLGITDKVSLVRLLSLLEEVAEYDAALNYANEVLDGFGIESITRENHWDNSYFGNIVALYVNMGDTYDATIVYDVEAGEFFVTSWGDWYEQWETEQETEEKEEEEEEVQEQEEDDLVTEDHVRFYQNRKLAFVVGEDENWQDVARDWMEEQGFFPNVWMISDHGNAHLLTW